MPRIFQRILLVGFWPLLFACAPLTPPVPQAGTTAATAADSVAAVSDLEVYLQQRRALPDTSATALPYLAVLPFDNRSKFRKGIWALEWDMATMLSRRMADHPLWQVIPIGAVGEAARGHGGAVDELLAIGRRLQADFIVRGVLEDYNMERLAVGDPLLGGYKSYKGTAKMSLDAWRVEDGQYLGSMATLQEPVDRGLGLDLLGKPREQDLQFVNLKGMVFGSEEFLGTAIGQATTMALDDLIAQLAEAVQPGQLMLQGDPGKILSVHGDEIYINLGSENGLYNGFRFEVFPGPGRHGGRLERVGVIEVEEVIGNRLSSVRVLQGKEQIEAGDLLQVVRIKQ